jgi:uncharacterized protein
VQGQVKTFRRAGLTALLLLILLIPPTLEARPVPELSGRVNDYAGLLAPATVKQLETVLADLEQSDSTQIVVLTITSLDGDSLEGFSLRVVEQWRIGRHELDNGALLLVARDDRKLRIEVGYGLEGTLTDLVAGQIIRNVITPQFRLGNFDQGVIDGVGAMIAAVRGEFQAPADKQRHRQGSGEDLGGLVTALLFLFFIFGSMFRRNKPLAAVLGGLGAPLIALLLFGITGLLLLLLIPAGALGGLIAASLSAGSRVVRSGGIGGWHRSGGGRLGGGGFGGFSGGGGGFGGGGASGGW